MSDLWTRKRFPRFTSGEIIVLTKDAIRRHIKGRGSIYGVALASRHSLGTLTVKVRRIDQRTPNYYHVTFWRHATKAERKRAPLPDKP